MNQPSTRILTYGASLPISDLTLAQLSAGAQGLGLVASAVSLLRRLVAEGGEEKEPLADRGGSGGVSLMLGGALCDCLVMSYSPPFWNAELPRKISAFNWREPEDTRNHLRHPPLHG